MMKNGKNETFRDKLQGKWAEEFLQRDSIGKYKLDRYSEGNSDKIQYSSEQTSRGILHICPRSGKIQTSIRIFCGIHRLLRRRPKILICYPDKNIQKSWEDDFQKVGYNNMDVNYITHTSLGKIVQENYDIIVCDEIHLLSMKQKVDFNNLMNNNPNSSILGLSGTLSDSTKFELKRDLGLNVISEYTIDEAVEDGLISDYRIKVIKVPLDNQTLIDKSKKTEKQKYNAISWVIKNKGQNLFLSLARMRIVHNSIAKLEATKKLLNDLKDKRVLVFCAGNKIAKDLDIQIHTSMFSDQEEFEKFINNSSSHNHLAVCKIGNTGVSFKSLDHIIINAFDSNSENLTQRICRSLILDEKDKISNIYIITSNEEAELKWLSKSLEFFNKNKIEIIDERSK